ncbi:MAG: hypothetical protein LBN74_02095 [Prevotella sp.]|nr:hypothetical protein [Prevotella sp.]
MRLKIYIACLVSSLSFLPLQKLNSCGFYETETDYRAMMFRVLLPGLKCLQPFTYTQWSTYYSFNDSGLTTDPDENDRYRNCAEWLAACKNKPTISDIYKIQYSTDASLFLKAFDENALNEVFGNNSFVKYLTESGNKDLLNYMLYAKKAERSEIGSSSRFEEWDQMHYYGNRDLDQVNQSNVKRTLLNEAQSALNKATSKFLKQRYAFQVCRLSYQMNRYADVIQTYDKYFGKVDKNNLMSVWAVFFRAMSTPSTDPDHYRYFIQAFNNSDEKKFRCVQLFDNNYNKKELTPKELSVAITMQALRNPGRALDQIKEAYVLDSKNEYIPFLVLREINKLEDWLITPLFYGKYSINNSDPFHCAYYDAWYESYKKEHPQYAEEGEKELQEENLVTDMQYMDELKSLFKSILSTATGEAKDFYAISLAHISLLQENTADANKYLAMVSDKAEPTTLLQKQLETIWLATKTQDINSNKFKDIFLQNITDLDRLSMPEYNNGQMLYTLTLSLANEYLKKGDRVYGNLMRLKSDSYRMRNNEIRAYYEWYGYIRQGDTYTTIEYFDKNATIADMDILIELLEKSRKTPFEEYLCNQSLSSVNAYKELKGTMAFRNNDLQLAYNTFSSMPQDYWQGKNFSFGDCLNEDPFVPKGLKANKYRKFDYKFNKADFIKELISLQEQANKDKAKSADYYNKLGDAYFNTSYWGNSWMMTRYSWSINDEYYSKIDCLPEWMRNYMTADIARDYYEKALTNAVNDEQKAYATVMLRYIHYLCYHFRLATSDKQLAVKYENSLKNYLNTQTYKTYRSNCIEPFIVNNSKKD